LANAILKFFEEKDKIDFASNIQKELDKYSWGKFTEELINLASKEETNL
jgi:hypothetical protein